MLDRLAQLIVERLRPQLEQLIREHFDELRLDIEEKVDELFIDSVNSFNASITRSIPQIQKELKSEIAQQIIRGVKR